nr:MAG TPA: hypothetical protein [Caudoviricetes sp.]
MAMITRSLILKPELSTAKKLRRTHGINWSTANLLR